MVGDSKMDIYGLKADALHSKIVFIVYVLTSSDQYSKLIPIKYRSMEEA
ncbi:MAG: hypothetical protein J7J89_05655 [Thermoplasmata archaeon]|nr:hypothetical protein [Thermoplasmata archaeon]